MLNADPWDFCKKWEIKYINSYLSFYPPMVPQLGVRSKLNKSKNINK